MCFLGPWDRLTDGSIGLTGAISRRDGIKRHQPLFPNRLILGADDNPGKLYTMLEATTAVNPHNHHGAMSDVRAEIENALRDRAYVKKANHTFVGALQPQEKVSIRRMMSCYWDNSSPFSLDLVGAVIRQGTFIEKMHSIDWIHSPTVKSTMNRLLEKYDRYFTLLAAHPNNTAVPTLDVDLAWHTHQLSPSTYYAHSLFKTRKLIDHDDKIDETALSTAFEWTSKTYQKMFNELYSECTCWYCEAIRESHSSPLSRIFSPNKSIETQLAAVHSASDPHSTPHISAHSAIRAETDENRAVREGLMRVKLEREYKKAAQRARKKGGVVPRRDEYMYASAYGYPIAMPYYAPYMGDPCTGGLYAADPGCASFKSGAVGNCCQGACGGGVAAGACGGGGSGGCAGGAAGGCGGGGGGGCGGGGGGCGGGGGGGGCGGGGGGC